MIGRFLGKLAGSTKVLSLTDSTRDIRNVKHSGKTLFNVNNLGMEMANSLGNSFTIYMASPSSHNQDRRRLLIVKMTSALSA